MGDNCLSSLKWLFRDPQKIFNLFLISDNELQSVFLVTTCILVFVGFVAISFFPL